MLQSTAPNSSTVLVYTSTCTRRREFFFSFGFAKFGVRWAPLNIRAVALVERGGAQPSAWMSMRQGNMYCMGVWMHVWPSFSRSHKLLAHNSTIVSIKGHTALVNEKGAASGPSSLFSLTTAGNSNGYYVLSLQFKIIICQCYMAKY